MVRSIFSRDRQTGGNSSAKKPSAHTAQTADSLDPKEGQSAEGDSLQASRGPLVREAAVRWRAELTEQTRRDAESGPSPRVTLRATHPGGMAQLYAERPTRLSSLVREKSAFEKAATALAGVLEKANELAARYGTSTIHLVIGVASWEGDRPAKSVPVLLRRLSIEAEDDGDFSLRIRSGVEVSNRLLDAFARVGKPLNAEALVDLMVTKHGFSPAPALKTFREVGASLPGFDLQETLSVGIYVHPASGLLRELGAPQSLSLSEHVRALAGDEAAKKQLMVELPAPNPEDRDPWQERGLGDQPPATQDAIEAATGDASVFVDVPPSADSALTVSSIAVEHAARGKHVLVACSNPGMRAQLAQTMQDYGVAELAAVLDSSDGADDAVLDQLHRTMTDLTPVLNQDEADMARTKLRRIRDSLSKHAAALHAVFPAWGVSAYDALQVLSELTSIADGPSTKVRVTEETLTKLSSDSGETARQLLNQAEELGMFSQPTGENAWRGVEFTSQEQVSEVLAALTRLDGGELSTVRKQMEETHTQTGLPAVNTLAKWADMLETLRGVRDSLDVFEPEIFEHSAADMVVATASKQWRKDRGIKLSGSQRRTLVRQAEDLALPGTNPEILHDQLVLVQARREEWLKICEGNTWPRLPRRFEDILQSAARVEADIAVVSRYVSSLYGDLRTLPMNELGAVIDRLGAQQDLARLIPLRHETSQALAELGLAEFVADMAERGVGGEMLGLELDLCWWASALTLMILREPDLGGFDLSALQDMLGEERKLDKEQVETLGLHAVQKVRNLRTSALSLHPDQHGDLMRELESVRGNGQAAVASLFVRYSLVWDLLPIAVVGQSLVPNLIPWGRTVDVVVLCGNEGALLAETIPVLARAKQVVVVADYEHAADNSVAGVLGSVLPHVRVQPATVRVNDRINLLLSKYLEESPAAAVPGRKARGMVEAIWASGTAMPTPGTNSIESSEGEAEIVAQAVTSIAHGQKAARRADATVDLPSVAVVALTDQQADRIRDLLRDQARHDEVLAEFLAGEGPEPFEVAGPERGAAIQRDYIVLSVSFAKTPHGRVIHDFGKFSQLGGMELLTQILLSARSDMTIISSLKPEDISQSRLHRNSERLLLDLLKLAEGTLNLDEEAPASPTNGDNPPDNLLVDLAERLYKIGLRVVPNLGAPGGMKIPLAIGHPEVPDELLVAILTDDADYLAEPSLRVRDRYWPELLENQGWKVRTELSMAVFMDPNKEAEQIVQLTLDAVDDYYVARGRPETPAAAAALGYLQVDDPAEAAPATTGIEAFYGQTASIPVIKEGQVGPAGEADGAVGSTEASSGDATDSAAGDSKTAGGAGDAGVGTEGSGTDESALPEPAPEPKPRGPRPPIAAGLPLSAYSDDQLDEVAAWIRSDGLPRSEDDMIQEIRAFLQLTRRGIQFDAVLRNVSRRTQ